MIRVSVVYPATEDARFDHDHYATKHMPLVAETMVPELVKAEFDRCLDGGDWCGQAPVPSRRPSVLRISRLVRGCNEHEGRPSGGRHAELHRYAPQLLVSETHEVG